MDIQDLRLLLDEEVELCLEDGETIRALIVFVNESSGDIVVNLLETDRPEKYGIECAAVVIPASRVLSASLLDLS